MATFANCDESTTALVSDSVEEAGQICDLHQTSHCRRRFGRILGTAVNRARAATHRCCQRRGGGHHLDYPRIGMCMSAFTVAGGTAAPHRGIRAKIIFAIRAA